MITQLFQNLHDHMSVEFAELDTSQLLLLNFDESGAQIKEILESTYTDGITGLEGVENDGKQITGVFLDKISPTITKRYKFTITPNNISYQLENPDDLEGVDFAEVEFAASKMIGGSKKPKNCANSTPCGKGCISKAKQCRKETTPAQKEAISAMVSANAQLVGKGKGKSKPPVKTSDLSTANPKTAKKSVAQKKVGLNTESVVSKPKDFKILAPSKYDDDAVKQLETWDKIADEHEASKAHSQSRASSAVIYSIKQLSKTSPNNFRGYKDSDGNLQSASIVREEGNSLKVDFLGTAPWNHVDDPRKTKYAGLTAMARIAQEAQKAGHGVIKLEPLPTAVDFYSKIGFKENPDDPNEWILDKEGSSKLIKLAKEKGIL